MLSGEIAGKITIIIIIITKNIVNRVLECL